MPMLFPNPRAGRALFSTISLFHLVVLLALVTSRPARAENLASTAPTLITVDEAMRRLTTHPAYAQQIEARLQIADGVAREQGLWPNPELTYEREDVPGIADSREEFLLLSQRFELSGRRGLLADSGKAMARAERLRVNVEANDIRTRALHDFYEALYLQARANHLREWHERLVLVLAAVEKRQAAGDVSGYDRMRVTKEVAAVRRALEVDESGLEQARRQLAAILLTEGDGVWRVEGTLAPVGEAAIRVPSVAALPSVAAYQYDAEAGQALSKASGRWWLPSLNVSGGAKRAVSAGQSHTGYVLSAGIELPIFDRHQGPASRASGERLLAEARGKLEERNLGAEIAGLSSSLDRKVDELKRSEGEPNDALSMVQSAEAAYGAGEFSVVELLDGYETAFEDQLHYLDLAWNARQTWLSLIRIAGQQELPLQESK